MEQTTDDGEGIIPARAGFTFGLSVTKGEIEDHPRSRGVYPGDLILFTTPEGSSPLARGLRSRMNSWHFLKGIIPARAGFTGSRYSAIARMEDHPRSRGVYFTASKYLCFCSGSSPLARGLHLRILGIPTNPHSTRPLLPSLPS